MEDEIVSSIGRICCSRQPSPGRLRAVVVPAAAEAVSLYRGFR